MNTGTAGRGRPLAAPAPGILLRVTKLFLTANIDFPT